MACEHGLQVGEVSMPTMNDKAGMRDLAKTSLRT